LDFQQDLARKEKRFDYNLLLPTHNCTSWLRKETYYSHRLRCDDEVGQLVLLKLSKEKKAKLLDISMDYDALMWLTNWLKKEELMTS